MTTSKNKGTAGSVFKGLIWVIVSVFNLGLTAVALFEIYESVGWIILGAEPIHGSPFGAIFTAICASLVCGIIWYAMYKTATDSWGDD